MAGLKQIVVEIHRRSLWQVLLIYLGAGWAVLQVVDQVANRYLLPEWVYAASIILLVLGLPMVLATAFVREEPASEARAEREGGTAVAPGPAASAAPATSPTDSPIVPAAVRFLTWRRTVLAGVLAFAGLAVVAGFIVVKGMPRVAEASGTAGSAFERRSWVVVADAEAPPDEAETAAAARTALVLDLSQSTYVNVYGRDQIEPVLARMGLPDTVRLDERLAREVAEREGLAAVLATSISRLGSDYVFGARVVEPASGRELIVVRTTARTDRLLDGVEKLSREVRGRLGEAAGEIRASRPLPEVTTRSLDALKTYARAVAALERDEPDRAADLALDAIRIDTSFAMAYRLVSVARSNSTRMAEARQYADLAYELRDRLTDRERLHVEANDQYLALEPRKAAATYRVLLDRYPDDFRAINNLAIVDFQFLGQPEEAFRLTLRALALKPYSPIAYGNAITYAAATGRWGVADSLAGQARDSGFARVASNFELSEAFVQGDLGRADALCDSLVAAPSPPPVLAGDRQVCGANDLARGRLRRGRERLEASATFFASRNAHLPLSATILTEVMADLMTGRAADAAARLGSVSERVPPEGAGELERSLMRENLQTIAALLGRADLVDRVGRAYRPYPDTSHWFRKRGDAIEAAARALAVGEAPAAVEALRAVSASGYDFAPLRNEVDLLYIYAFDEQGAVDSAIAHLRAVVEDDRFFVGPLFWRRGLLPIALRHLGELEEQCGDTAAAIRHDSRLLALWSDADPELGPQVTQVRRALARLSGAEGN